MDYKIGDFTGINNAEGDGVVSKEDVQYFLSGMKNGLFLDRDKPYFEISNISKKDPYRGPGFFEVLKLNETVKSGDGIFGDDESEKLDDLVGPVNNSDIELEISEIVGNTLVHYGQKGSAIDTYMETIVASVPCAKIKNFFHKNGDSSTPVEKNIGYVKIYSLADKQDYSEYDIVLPPVFSNKNEELVPDELEFGKESVSIYGDFLAVSAFYSRPIVDELERQPKSAKIFLYKKYPTENPNDSGFKFYTVIEDFEFAVEPVLEMYQDFLFASDYKNNFIKVYSIEKLESLSNYETATPLSKIEPGPLTKPLNGDAFNSEWGRSIVCRDGFNLFVGAPNAIVGYGVPISTGEVQHFAYDESELVPDDGTSGAPNVAPDQTPWKYLQSITLPVSIIPHWSRHSDDWYDFANSFLDGDTNYKDNTPKTADCGWDIRDDLNSYFEELDEELPPFTCAYYLVADTRMGESIDFRIQEHERNDGIKDRTYLAVGCPNYFDDTDPNKEPSSKDGCVVIYDVSVTYTDISPIQIDGGNHQMISRVIANSITDVKAMEVNDSPGSYFDQDDVSIHIQSELPTQTELINRGSPLYWSNKITPFVYEGVTHESDETLLLHSAPYSKSYMKVGDGNNSDGNISFDEQSEYLLTDDLTIEFWYRMQSPSGGSSNKKFIVGTNDRSSAQPQLSLSAWGLYFDTNNSKFEFKFNTLQTDPDNVVEITEVTTTQFDPNVWHHIAIVHEKYDANTLEGLSEDTRLLNVYIDGVKSIEYTFHSSLYDVNLAYSSVHGTILSFASLKTNSNELVNGASCHLDDIRITHGIRYTEDFDAPIASFPIFYYPKALGTSVAMDDNYDVYALDNTLGGFISKHPRIVSSESSSSWGFSEKVSLSKDEPVVGGEISIYSLDLVYGNKNDLRIYPRTPNIKIHGGGNKNTDQQDIDLSYTISNISTPYDYSVALTGSGIIDWGDGTHESFDFRNGFGNFTHKYESDSDNFVIKVYGATAWGESKGASVGESKVSHVSKLSQNVTQLSGSFKGAVNFNQDISGWNTSNITGMDNLFNGATSFNQDISTWNVQNVTSMVGMFATATSFNQNLSEWCVTHLDAQLEFALNSAMSPEQIPEWGTCNNYIDFYFDTTSLDAPLVIPFLASHNNTFDSENGYTLNITWGDSESETFTSDNPLFARNNYYSENLNSDTISALFPTKTENIPNSSEYKVRLVLPELNCKLVDIPPALDSEDMFPTSFFTSPTKIKIKRGDYLVGLDCTNYQSLHEVDLSESVLSNIETLKFKYCKVLNKISWPTELNLNQVTTFYDMFSGCEALTEIDLTSFRNTQNVTSASSMFMNCSSLTSLNVGEFTCENVISADFMFDKCAITNIDWPHLNTRNIITANSMFSNMPNFIGLTFGGDWQFDNLEHASMMFGHYSYQDTSKPRLIGSMTNAMGTLPKIKNISGFFKNLRELSDLGWTDTESPTFENVTDISEMYYGVNAVKRSTLENTFSNANTINLKRIDRMLGHSNQGDVWYDSESTDDTQSKVITDVLKIISSSLNTDSVTSAKGFVEHQTELENFEVDMNLTNAMDMSKFFYGCQNLVFSGFSHNFNASELQVADFMFANVTHHNDFIHWDTSKLLSAKNMFEGNTFTAPQSGYTGIEGWNVTNLKYADKMFYGSEGFNEDLSSWCTTSIESYESFNDESNLTTENLPIWDSGECPDNIITITHTPITTGDSTLNLPVSIGDNGIEVDWGLGEGFESYSKNSDTDILTKDIDSNSGRILIKGDLKHISFGSEYTTHSLPYENYDFLDEGRNIIKYYEPVYETHDSYVPKYDWYPDTSLMSYRSNVPEPNIFTASEHNSSPQIHSIKIKGMSSIVSANYMFANIQRDLRLYITEWDSSNVKTSVSMFESTYLRPQLIFSSTIRKIIENTIDCGRMFASSNFLGVFNEYKELVLDLKNAESIANLFSGTRFPNISDSEIGYTFKLNIPKCKFAFGAFHSLSRSNPIYSCSLTNTNKLYDTSRMFANTELSNECAIEFSETDCIISAYQMFAGTSIHNDSPSEFVLSGTFYGLKNSSEMFHSCSAHTISAPNFSGKSVINASWMFQYAYVTSIDFPQFEAKLFRSQGLCSDISNVKRVSFPKLQISNLGFRSPTANSLFRNCPNLIYLKLRNDFINLDEGHFVSLESMFHNCSSFNQWDIRNLDTTQVYSMSNMFRGCIKFDVDLRNWNVSNTTNFNKMFREATSFRGRGLRHWNIGGGDDWKVSIGEPRYTSGAETLEFDMMFRDAVSFNEPINSWGPRIYNSLTRDVTFYDHQQSSNARGLPSVRNYSVRKLSLRSTFNGATSFNRDLSSWSSAIGHINSTSGGEAILTDTFKNCTSLNSNFSGWKLPSYLNISQSTIDSAFENSGVPTSKQIIAKPESDTYSEIGITISDLSNMNFVIRCATDSFTVDWGDGNGDITYSIEPDTGNINTSPKFISKSYTEASAEDFRFIVIKGAITCVEGVVGHKDNVKSTVNWAQTSEFQDYTPHQNIGYAIIGIKNSGDALNFSHLTHGTNSSDNGFIQQLQISEYDYSDADFTNSWVASPDDNIRQFNLCNYTQLKRSILNHSDPRGFFSFNTSTEEASDVHVKVPDNFDLDEIYKWVGSVCGLFKSSRILKDDMNTIVGDATLKNIHKKSYLFQNSNFPGAEIISQLDMSRTTHVKSCFSYLKSHGTQQPTDAIDVSGYDTSNIVEFDEMFGYLTNGNMLSGIENWDVSNGITFYEMFHNCTSFNLDVSGWNIRNARNLARMFKNATGFNRDLSSWDFINTFQVYEILESTQSPSISYGKNNINLHLDTSHVGENSDLSSATSITIETLNTSTDPSDLLDLSKYNISSEIQSILIKAPNYTHDLSNVKLGNLKYWTMDTENFPLEKQPKLVQLHTRGIIPDLQSKENVATIMLEFVDGVTSFGFTLTHGENLKIYWNPDEEPEVHESANAGINYSRSQSSNFSNVVIQGNINNISFVPDDTTPSGIKYALVHDVSNNIRSFDAMFKECKELETVDMTGCAVHHSSTSTNFLIQTSESHQRSAAEMFTDCESLVDVSFYEPINQAKSDYNSMLSIDNLTHTLGWITTANNLFSRCEKLKELSLKTCFFDMCQDYYAMFNSCYALESIKFPTLSNTSQGIASGSLNSFVSYPISMGSMFQNCWKLKSVDLSSFEGKSVNNISSMFYSTKVITEIDVSPLVVSSDILSLVNFFNRCYKLEKIKGLKYISTKNVTTMNHAFRDCNVITDLSDINDWNTENTSAMSSFLRETNALTNINLKNWCVKNITEKPSDFVHNSNIETTISKHPRWGVCPSTNLDNTPNVLINLLPPTPTPTSTPTPICITTSGGLNLTLEPKGRFKDRFYYYGQDYVDGELYETYVLWFQNSDDDISQGFTHYSVGRWVYLRGTADLSKHGDYSYFDGGEPGSINYLPLNQDADYSRIRMQANWGDLLISDEAPEIMYPHQATWLSLNDNHNYDARGSFSLAESTKLPSSYTITIADNECIPPPTPTSSPSYSHSTSPSESLIE